MAKEVPPPQLPSYLDDGLEQTVKAMNETQEFMLTTEDNPYNPFTHWDEWFAFDKRLGYNSCEYLARVLVSSDDLSEADQKLAFNQAVNEIVDLNLLGIYTKVYKP